MSAGPIVVGEDNVDVIFDNTAAPSTAGHNSWGWDLAFDKQNNPVVTYATFVQPPGGPTDGSQDVHQYHYARWTGSSWLDRTLVSNAGGHISNLSSGPDLEYWYSGGIEIDPVDPNILYLSRKVNGQFELEQWKTADSGATWSTLSITSTPGLEDVRPFVPPTVRRTSKWSFG
ncbi:MAG TPA: hypothetical protein VK324_11650 [Tepidisphaeraceae bacterium]|nr:hypothetical protein [Tepidisphaeraceae bacterium]